MFFFRCAFCHKLIFRPFYNNHRETHVTRKPDGQMTDHITVHPEGRYKGSLDNVPQSYFHPHCGVSTCMPDEIIRSYLVNPFLYSGGSFCCGCEDYVSTEALFWDETDECLADYFDRLQQRYLRKYGEPPPRPHV